MNKMSETLKLIKSGLIKASRGELNLRACLKGGMSFRWTLDNEQQNFTEYTGIIGDKVVRLKQILDNNAIEYSVYANIDEETDFEPVLSDYFRLNENLADLYSYWSDRDEKFKEKVGNHADVLGGIRVLRIDPVENLFSFICSSNNGIPRITQMVANLCIHFGKLIGQMSDGRSYYSFPSIESLTKKGVDLKLRELKFGYRARFIHDAASYIHKKTDGEGEKWLHSLRERPYEEVHAELVKIPGVGKKVADCICLMSMDKLEAIPVDTHVFQMAKNYGFVRPDKLRDTKKGSNSLSDSSYREIANKFRELWGKYAGWAQTVMFVDDLREFKQLQKSKSDLKIEEAKKEPLENDQTSTSSNSNKRSAADQRSTTESSQRKKKLKS